MNWTPILIAGAAGGVALFFWYGLAWMALKHHVGDFKPLPKSDLLVQELAKVPPVDAFYALPHPSDFPQGMKDPKLAERWNRGPNVTLIAEKPGPCMTGATFLRGFAGNLVEAVFGAWLLTWLRRDFDSFGEVMGLFAGIGLFISFATHYPQSNYARFPWRFFRTNTFDKVAGYAILGAVLHLLLPVG